MPQDLGLEDGECHRAVEAWCGMKGAPDVRAAALAEKQAGCISRGQAHQVGVTDRMIKHRLATCRWRRQHPGVYVVGGVPTSWLQDVWAAVLAVGEEVTVSYETALLLHGAVTDVAVARYPITLMAAHGRHARVAGAVVHQIDDLRPQHITRLAGLDVCLPARVVVDMAATTGEKRLGNLLDDLIVSRRTTLAEVATYVQELARPGKPGIAKLARVLDHRGPGYVPPHSALERKLLACLHTAGLPPPIRQLPLPGRGAIEGIADAGYPDARLLIEADGRRWHTRIRDIGRDHARDAEAARAGWMTLRFVYEQIVGDPAEVAATVADVRRRRLAEIVKLAS